MCKLQDFVLNVGPPEITAHPTGGDVPMGRNITLMCRSSGLGTLVYSWERRSSGSSWTTVSNDNTTSYTTDTTLTIGEYMYRCNVSNEAGSVVSNSATVNVYGEYNSAEYYACDKVFINFCRSSKDHSSSNAW